MLLSPFVYCVEVSTRNSSRLRPSIPFHATTMMYMMRSSLDSTPFHATPRDVKSCHVIPCSAALCIYYYKRKCRNVVALGVTRRDANPCYAIHLPPCDAIRGATRHDSMGYNVIAMPFRGLGLDSAQGAGGRQRLGEAGRFGGPSRRHACRGAWPVGVSEQSDGRWRRGGDVQVSA